MNSVSFLQVRVTARKRRRPSGSSRALMVDTRTIPPGTYLIQYVVEDMFTRRIPMEGVKVTWDGQRLSLAEGETWEGTVSLRWE